MKSAIVSLDGEKQGDVELDAFLFGLKPRADILHRMVRYQLAARRAGTHKAKSRGEIIGTTHKTHRQKGTGHARHGSRKANLFRGGGATHGPHPRDHSHKLPKKFRALALRHALSAKAKEGTLTILDKITAAEPKTSKIKPKLEGAGLVPALLIDRDTPEQNFSLAVRNIPGVETASLAALNVYDILRCKKLALTLPALEGLKEKLSDKRGDDS